MKKIYGLSLLLCLLSGVLLAQTGGIRGRITTADGTPAEFVNVNLKGTRFGSLSGENGAYEIKNIKPGSYTLRISLIGLQTKEQSVQVNEGEVTELPDIMLSEDANQLKEVLVMANREKYNDPNLSNSLRLASPILETSQNIQVVTSKTLADQQVISMSDGVIRNVSGAVRLEHWGDLYTNISMRGSQIQAFRNGFNVVSSFWGPLTEDISIVDHIEFVKGPAGFMLANGDPSGLYNVVTKKPTGQNKGEVSFTLGSYDLYRASVDLDGKLSKDGRFLYRFNVAAQNKKSHRPYEYNNRYTIAPVFSYQINPRTKLTFEYTLQYAKMSDVGSFYVFSPDGYATLPVDFTSMPPGLAPTNIYDHSTYANIQHEINDNWKLTAQLSYFKYNQKGSSMWPVSVGTDGKLVRGVGIWDAISEMTLGQAFVNGNVKTGPVAHRILAGLDMGSKDYMADWAQSHALDSVGAEFDPKAPYYGTPVNGFPVYDRTLNLEARAVNGGGTMDQRYAGIYVQDELGFFNNRVRLTLAGRYTYVSQSSWGGAPISAKHFTPRLGLSVSLDKNTALYGVYDQAFIPQGGRLAGGGDVKPITGNNTEFGIKRDWANGQWNTTLSVYRILKNNELTADPNSPPNAGLSVVLGQKQAQGVEFDLRGTIVRGLNLVANYAYTDSKVTRVTPGVESIAVGDLIPGFAKHVVNGWLGYKFTGNVLNGLGLSAGFTYQGDRAMSNWSTTDTKANLPNYFKMDAGIFYEKDKFRITANMFNVLNEYLYSGGYYTWLNAYNWQTEAPRNMRLSISHRF